MDMDSGTVTAAGVVVLITTQVFKTIRTIIANRNGSGDLARAERLAVLELKFGNYEKLAAKTALAVGKILSALRKKGWIR